MSNMVAGKTFFITGGAGFVGSNMIERLLADGAEVVAYDNLSSGKYEFLKKFEGEKGFEFIKADILDTGKLEKSLKSSDSDTIIHFAANADIQLGTKETDLDIKSGTMLTYNVLEAARKCDVSRILFSSSSVVYGIPTIRPTPENYGPMSPISLYGASKLASEGLITAFSHLFGMKYYIYRFANVVGKNSTHGVIFDFVRKLQKNNEELEVLGDGKQKKSYIDVGDCIDAMLYVYSKSGKDENIYNISTEDQVSVREIAETVVKKFMKGARIRYTGTKQGWPGDIANTFLSSENLTKFGWKARYSAHQAVDKAIDIVLAETN